MLSWSTISKKLETDTFTGNGLEEYFEKRVNDETKLLKYLRKGPIFMVTGIKYSTDLKWKVVVGKTSDAHAKLHGTVTEDVSAGAQATTESNWTSFQRGEISEEAIFAYQVHRITYKGWFKKKNLESRLNHEGAGLSDGEDDDEDDVENDDDAESDEEKELKGQDTLDSELFNSIEGLAVEDGMRVWDTDGEFVHAS